MLGVLVFRAVSFVLGMHVHTRHAPVRETTESESQNLRLQVRQEEETYNICGGPRLLFGRLIFQYASFNNSRSLQLPARHWAGLGILWFHRPLAESTMAFNLQKRFQLNQSILDGQARDQHLG